MGKNFKIITVERDVLRKNNDIALLNKKAFDESNAHCINLLSSPGSGKTSILEVIIPRLIRGRNVYVIEGDVETPNDGLRIEKTGAGTIQITTLGSCHLDAGMVEKAFRELDIRKSEGPRSMLFIENVGNLVCPASFYLGEHLNGVVLSVTEGDDKPLKYPKAFRNAHFIMINKTDLLPYVDFDISRSREYILKINPGARIFEMSAKTGEGIDGLIAWLNEMAR